jgi:hypothetical protein
MKWIGKLYQYIYTTRYTKKIHRATTHRVKMLDVAITYITYESISGGYYEFGVARGLTFISAYHISKNLDAPINKFHALDSFEGLPKPEGPDKELERFKEGAESWSLQTFEKNLKKRKVDDSRVEIYRGWFKDTWTKDVVNDLKEKGENIAIAWIDCDMYQSTKDALDNIRPLLQQGTVLIFDDWFCYKGDPTKGEQRATKEFLENNEDISLTQFYRFGITGNSFIVTVK